MRYDGEWRIDMESLLAGLHPRTRALVVVHRNNPTGSFVKENEWQQIRDTMATRNIAVIVDEVFACYPWFDDERRWTQRESQNDLLLFSLNGLSKLAGLPQLKLGWLIVSGPPELLNESLLRLEILSDTYLSVATPVEQALPLLLQNASTVGEEIRARLRDNLNLLRSLFTRPAAASLLQGEGGWNVVIRLPNTRSDEEWAYQLLAEDHIVTHPGELFGMDEGEHLILSLLPKTEMLEKAARLLIQKVA